MASPELDDLTDWVCRRIWVECDAAAILVRGHEEAATIVGALAQGFLDEAQVGS